MDENANKEVNTGNSPEKKAEEIQAIKTTEFMKETIKQRPINRKKLVRRLMITILMAVVFGMVACLTFLLLEPVISSKLNREDAQEEILNIDFSEDIIEEETLPQDMIADESELQTLVIEQAPLDDEQIEQVLDKIELGVDEYLTLSSVITDMISNVSGSLVDVVSVTQDRDWFNNEYSSEEAVSGVIIADNGRDYLIMTDLKRLNSIEDLQVEFWDGYTCRASLVMQDSCTGIGIVSVIKVSVRMSTQSGICIIEMGSSANKNLNATPIVALGRTIGSSDSVGVGYISSYESMISLADGNYRLLTTDIYGSSNASGFLVNLKGQLMGIIDMSKGNKDTANMICGIGISELKRMAEKLSNGREIPYLGIYGTDITEEISVRMNIPMGVYIQKLDMDSPLLTMGIQSGDVITKFNELNVSTFQDMNNFRLALEVGDLVKLMVRRNGPDGYTEHEYIFELPSQR